MPSRDPTEILVALHRRTAGAYLVSNDGVNEHAKWISRTLVTSMHETGQTTRGTDRDGQQAVLPLANMTVPEWLAIKEGFV